MKTPSCRVFPVSGKSTNWFEVSFPGLTKNYFTWSLFIRLFLMPEKSLSPDSNTDDAEIELTPQKNPKRLNHHSYLLKPWEVGSICYATFAPQTGRNWAHPTDLNRLVAYSGFNLGLASLGEADVPHLAALFVPSFIISLITCLLCFKTIICQIAPFLEWTQCVSYYHSPIDVRNCRIPISSLCFCFGVFKCHVFSWGRSTLGGRCVLYLYGYWHIG